MFFENWLGKRYLWLWVSLLGLFVACQPAELPPTEVAPTLSETLPATLLATEPSTPALDDMAAQEVQVILQEVTVNIDQEGVTAVVRGVANDACLTFEVREQRRENVNVNLDITAVRTQADPCPSPELDRPFTARLPLATLGWPDGFYVLTINDTVSTGFPYQTVMLSGGGMEVPAQEDFLELEGRVWHDLCTGGEDERCVNGRGDGVYTAGEPGLAQVTVSLNRDTCPGSGTLLTTRTQFDGRFRFAGLVPGSYCVAITAGQGANRALLQPGVWTASPEYLSDEVVYVDVNSDRANLDFGWDYANLPRDTSGGACINQALFVQHLNHAGGVTLSPGQSVVKGWRVLNSGTCSWSTEYDVVGNLGGAVAFPQRVLPGETVDLEVPLVAPQQAGAYVGRWVLQNEAGERFGIGITGTGALTAELLVPAPTRLPNPTAVLTATTAP